MTAHMRRGFVAPLRLLVGLAVFFLTTCVMTSPTWAGAATKTPATSVNQVTATTVSPSILGLPTTLELVGKYGSGALTFPATPGIEYTSITLKVTWPTFISRGQLEVDDTTNNGQRLGVIESPSNLVGNETWTVPLTTGVNRADTIGVKSTLVQPILTELCGPTDAILSLHVQPVSVSYRVVNHVKTVGSYLSGPIRHLTVRFPGAFRYDVASGAVELASAVASANVNANMTVTAISTDAPLSAVVENGPFDRVITFNPASPPYLTLNANPSIGLVVGGTGVPLENQVRALTGRVEALLQTSAVGSLIAHNASVYQGTRLTLAQLGVGTVTGSGAGQFSLPISFTQSAVNYQFQSARFDLNGTSQVSPENTSVGLTLEIGGVPITSTHPDANGAWTMSGTVPANLVQRSINASVVVSFFGTNGNCSGLTPITVAVNQNSTVTLTPGTQAQITGFAAMPQNLLPTADVVLAPSLSQLNLALQVVVGVQRTSTLPLILTAVPQSAWTGSSNAIVVARADEQVAKYLYPVSPVQNSINFQSHDGSFLSIVNPNLSFLSVGTSSQGGNFVALIEDSPSDAQRLLNGLNAESFGWQTLGGDTAVVGPDQVIYTAFTNPPTLPKATAVLFAWLKRPWVLFLLGGVALLLLLFGVPFLRRWTRGWLARRRGEEDGDDTSPDEPTDPSGSDGAGPSDGDDPPPGDGGTPPPDMPHGPSGDTSSVVGTPPSSASVSSTPAAATPTPHATGLPPTTSRAASDALPPSPRHAPQASASGLDVLVALVALAPDNQVDARVSDDEVIEVTTVDEVRLTGGSASHAAPDTVAPSTDARPTPVPPVLSELWMSAQPVISAVVSEPSLALDDNARDDVNEIDPPSESDSLSETELASETEPTSNTDVTKDLVDPRDGHVEVEMVLVQSIVNFEAMLGALVERIDMLLTTPRQAESSAHATAMSNVDTVDAAPYFDVLIDEGRRLATNFDTPFAPEDVSHVDGRDDAWDPGRHDARSAGFSSDHVDDRAASTPSPATFSEDAPHESEPADVESAHVVPVHGVLASLLPPRSLGDADAVDASALRDQNLQLFDPEVLDSFGVLVTYESDRASGLFNAELLEEVGIFVPFDYEERARQLTIGEHMSATTGNDWEHEPSE